MKEAEEYIKNSNFNKYVASYDRRFYPSYWMRFEKYYHEKRGTLDTIYEIYWEYCDNLYSRSKYSIKQFLKNFLAHIYKLEEMTIPHHPEEIIINKENKDEVIRKWNETLGIKT